MLVQILILLVGFLALVKGADFFVEGSSGLARIFRIPGLIIGLTIAAMGTSAPELAVSVSAALEGSNEIALSNVVGSNIFNLLMVLGCCALLHPVPVEGITIKRDCTLSLGAAAFVLLTILFQGKLARSILHADMSAQMGNIFRWCGLVMIVAFLVYMGILVRNALKHPALETEEATRPVWQCLVLIVVGIVMIVAGGKAVVSSAREIALFCGMSETLVGLTIVAIGTSLPELVTSVVAARKNETGLAIGNVVGSNIFNMMFILGISSALHPVAVNVASFLDLIILIAVTLITMFFAFSKKSISRIEGIVMVLIYVADVAFAVIR